MNLKKRIRELVFGCGIVFLLSAGNAAADGIGITFSTNTFVGSLRDGDPAPGLYCRAGFTWLAGRHLELELYHIPQITPRLYSQAYFGFSAGYWLLARKEISYLNAIVEGGLLYGLDQTRHLNLKITPIVFGCPGFRFAEKFCTVGLLFDPQRKRLLWQVQLLSLTLYL